MSIYSEGIEKGRAEGLSTGILDLLSGLGPVPNLLRERVLMQTDEIVLRNWLQIASRANSIEEFCAQIR